MYNERRDSFDWKTIILQFLFVVLFIFVLVWLFPLKSDLKNAINDIDTGSETDLSIFYDQIFNDNVIKMKDAAKSYYTTARLPQNVGNTSKLTLKEMLDKKIILPFVDSKGNQCDLTASYVEVTKYEDEFVMKVNLKCTDQENYLLVYMGCYDYCETAICEKNKTDMTNPVVYSTTTNKPVTQQTQSAATNTNSNSSTVTNKTTNIYNTVINNVTNVITNITTNVTIKNEDKTPDPTPSVTPDKKAPSCELEVVSGTKGSNGAYTSNIVIGFKSKTAGQKITGFGLGLSLNYNGNTTYTVSADGVTTVYGYIKDENGLTAICDITVAKETKKAKEYLYEYKKTTEGTYTYGSWSAWQTAAITATSTLEVKTRTVQQKVLTSYKVTTQPDLTQPIYAQKEVGIAWKNVTYCKKFGYVGNGGTVKYGDWKYAGTVVLKSAPSNTATTKYVRVTSTEWICQSLCNAGSDLVYKMYTREAVNSVEYKCLEETTKKTLVTATKTVVTGYKNKTTKEPVYETRIIKQYASRTKKYTPGTTDVKWSKYNDTTLLNKGYVYTGNRKVK